MRMGVLSAADITGTISSVGAGTAQPVTTYGPNVAGDTLSCPPGYPYDPGIKDCLGYAGSPADVAAQEAQALIDACASGGGSWNLGTNSCVMPGGGSVPVIVPSSLIPGIPNAALYIAGGVVLFALFAGKR